MSKREAAFTATHYAAAAFSAALFAMVGVLAVIGGTASGETTESNAAPAEELAELDTHTDEETVKPEREHSLRHRPAGRQGPPSFDDMDADSDGNITRAEFDTFRASHRPPGPRGQQHARGDFDGPRGPRGFNQGEFQRGDDRGHQGRPPHMREGGRGEHRQGPPPHMRGRGKGEHRQGPPPHMRGRGMGEHRQGPPPNMRGRGMGEHRQGPPPNMRGRGMGGHRQGPPPHMRDGEGYRGPRRGGNDDSGGPPPRPDFNQLDSDGDGSVSEQEFEDFRPPRGPRGGRDFPREESF